MISNKALALWHESPTSSCIKSVDLPEEPILVNSLYSFVSLGTERLVSTGNIDPSLNEQMKVPYMKGNLSLPCTYGYSLIGKIEGTDSIVHLLHPHQDTCRVSTKSIFELPSAEPRYALLSNMETALNIYWDATEKPVTRVLILGAGIIGILTASIFKKAGKSVSIYDINHFRSHKAVFLGFDKHTTGKNYDVVINTSSSTNGLNMAIELVRKEGLVIEASWYGKGYQNIKLSGRFHYDRLQIKSSQVSSIPEYLQGKWDFVTRKQKCLSYLLDEQYEAYIDRIIDFEELPAEFSKIRKNQMDYLSLLVKYQCPKSHV